MIIFLNNVPENTAKHEIADFLETLLTTGAENASLPAGSVRSVELLSIRDLHSGMNEQHALATVHPTEAAQRLLDRLPDVPFKGRPLSVREYVARSLQNDPRRAAANAEQDERRANERRRKPVLQPQKKGPILVDSH